jgi:hypothetical protein
METGANSNPKGTKPKDAGFPPTGPTTEGSEFVPTGSALPPRPLKPKRAARFVVAAGFSSIFLGIFVALVFIMIRHRDPVYDAVIGFMVGGLLAVIVGAVGLVIGWREMRLARLASMGGAGWAATIVGMCLCVIGVSLHCFALVRMAGRVF